MKTLTGLVVLVSPLALCAIPISGEVQESQIEPILIRVEEASVVFEGVERSRIRVVVPTRYVNPGDELTWELHPELRELEQGLGFKLEWAVHFPAPSPLVRVEDGRPVRRVRRGDPPVRIRDNNPAGKYNYFVAVMWTDGHIYTEDPPLIDEGDEG